MADNNEIQAGDFQLPAVTNYAAPGSRAAVTPRATRSIELPGESARTSGQSLDDYLESIERREILTALEKTRWNRSEAARLLGMTFRSLRYRLKKLGIDE
jgi:two-component system response regulator PilR (NtrC family)